ncbi:hypothetical protein ACP70R_030546 [Stipagrostis hirtigluma subsp. patula]
MKQQSKEISEHGMYTYMHCCEGGVDIHDIFVKKRTSRVLLSYPGSILLLASVCHTLLSKLCQLPNANPFMSCLAVQIPRESLGLGSLWSITFAGIIAKCLWYNPVKKVIDDHA